jgi:pilus assembly protein CpaE
MSDKIRVLIVDDIVTTRENIVKLIQFHPDLEVVGQAASGEEALLQAKALRPEVVLMDINMPGMDGIAATERLSVEVPESMIIIMSVQREQEYLRKAMMAGAKNYLTKPFTGDELIQAIRQAVDRERKIRDSLRVQSGAKLAGKVISVFSGKGGVGKTMIAVNLAVALAKRPNVKVAIVDADIQFGDVALFMNLLPRSTIADVLSDVDHLDDKILGAYMTVFDQSIQVLAAPLRPEQAEMVNSPLVGAILKQLRKSFDYIVVDTAAAFNEVGIAALDAADTVMVVAAVDLPTVKNTKLALEILQSLGYGDEKIQVVVNCPHSEGGIESREVEESLKKKIVATIPTDGKTVVNSINKGLPFVTNQPETLVAQKMVAIADKLFPWDSEMAGEAGKSGRRFKLFGR